MDWRPEKWEQIKAGLLAGWDGTERNLGCLVEDTASAIVEAAAIEAQKELAKKLTKDFGGVDLIDKVALWDWLQEKGLL